MLNATKASEMIWKFFASWYSSCVMSINIDGTGSAGSNQSLGCYIWLLLYADIQYYSTVLELQVSREGDLPRYNPHFLAVTCFFIQVAATSLLSTLPTFLLSSFGVVLLSWATLGKPNIHIHRKHFAIGPGTRVCLFHGNHKTISRKIFVIMCTLSPFINSPFQDMVPSCTLTCLAFMPSRFNHANWKHHFFALGLAISVSRSITDLL